jgi:Transposase, Mutator family
VYLWVDGIHLGIRLEEDKLCLPVMIGVRAHGRKELAALADGYRESAGSWADLLRDAARRGMRAPVLAIGDGAPGRLPAHQPQLPWPFLMLLSRGVTSRPQFRHWLRHGVITFTYGSRGSRPTALKSAIASASGPRCLSLCASRRHLGSRPSPA